MPHPTKGIHSSSRLSTHTCRGKTTAIATVSQEEECFHSAMWLSAGMFSAAFDPIVETAAPLQRPQQDGAPKSRQLEAVPERQETTRDDKKDRVKKTSREKKNAV